MIIVTGGAGFIGSAIAAALNRRGRSDLWIVDLKDHPEKELNLAALQYERFLNRDEFQKLVLNGDLPQTEAVFHLGACSSTTETDVAFLKRNNVEYTCRLAEHCFKNSIRFIYASSAATYGDGENGYSDDEELLETFKPLNPYGQSKQDFDLIAKKEGWLNHIVGLKYFNVYGPNEYHKEDMRSMVLKGYQQARDNGVIRLFKSYRPEYSDGGQLRDFLYVKDAVAMTLFFWQRHEVNGIFNIGSGKARCWNDLAASIFSALEDKPNIEYIEMPESIRNQYQYFTEAPMAKLQQAGFRDTPLSLEEGVQDYIRNYLMHHNRRLGTPRH